MSLLDTFVEELAKPDVGKTIEELTGGMDENAFKDSTQVRACVRACVCANKQQHTYRGDATSVHICSKPRAKAALEHEQKQDV